MRGYASSIRLFAGIIGIAVTVASCATTQSQQSQVRDETDQLFLDFAAIAQAPSPPTKPYPLDEDAVMRRMPAADTPICWRSKYIDVLVFHSMYLEDLTKWTLAEPWGQVSAEMRKDLLRVQDASQHCAGHEFPQVVKE